MKDETPNTKATCWTLILAVHNGDEGAKTDFVQRYLPAVRAYLEARWRRNSLSSECEDAAHEVFVRCFSEAGPLERLTRASEGGFRGYLYGITRNVAREHEQSRARRPAPNGQEMGDLMSREERLSTLFDRQFARQVMREARTRFRDTMLAGDEASRARLDLLTKRFDENLPIREIAAQRCVDAARLHKDYARARREFRQALLEVVAEQNPGATAADHEKLSRRLVELLG